jgi:hypothetical protein
MKFTTRNLELTLALVVLHLPARAAPMATPLAEATGMVLPPATVLPSPTRPLGHVHPAAAAGSWYPDDPEELALMSAEDEETMRALADALVELLPGRGAVVAASSDLSHYPAYDDAHVTDGATLAAIETGDPARVQELLGGER